MKPLKKSIEKVKGRGLNSAMKGWTNSSNAFKSLNTVLEKSAITVKPPFTLDDDPAMLFTGWRLRFNGTLLEWGNFVTFSVTQDSATLKYHTKYCQLLSTAST